VISGALAFLGYGYFADPTSPLGRFATYVFVMLALGIPVGLITSYFIAKLVMRDPDDARKWFRRLRAALRIPEIPKNND